MGIVTWGGSVGSAVTFSSRLDPNDSINERRASVGGWPHAEACTLNVAPKRSVQHRIVRRIKMVLPVTPLLTDVLDTRATLVNDERSRESLRRESRSKGLEVYVRRIDVQDIVDRTSM